MRSAHRIGERSVWPLSEPKSTGGPALRDNALVSVRALFNVSPVVQDMH